VKLANKHNAFSRDGMNSEHLKKMRGLKPTGEQHSDEDANDFQMEVPHPSHPPIVSVGTRVLPPENRKGSSGAIRTGSVVPVSLPTSGSRKPDEH
jgi:hypothetical protein